MALPVAVIQLDVDASDPEGNLAAALALASDAIARGARIVALPEACVSDIYKGAEARAESIPGALTDAFSKIAANAVIALPLLEKNADGIFSSCALIDAKGVQGVARKTHLYHDPTGLDLFRDAEVVHAGNELRVFDINGVRIGVALGFDAEFPEVFRSLTLKGADVIVAAVNCVEPDVNFLRGMAQRNRIPVAVANRIGFKRIYPSAPEFSAAMSPIVQDKRGEFLMRCRGGSAIIGPDGKIEARAKGAETAAENVAAPERVKIPENHFQDEEILMASFVIDELRIARMTHPLVTGRRVDLY
jgi:predicted amidohydrolase